MRITNSMSINNLMLQLNKNMTKLSKLQMQQASEKKIQYASDDPLIAGRALKFRTNIAENLQYQENSSQARAWITTSEDVITKTFNEMMFRLKELTVSASSENYSPENRKAIVEEIKQIKEQIGFSLNQTYAGRYIFSGFRTDNETVFSQNYPNESFAIHENFSLSNIEDWKVLNEGDPTATPPVMPGTEDVCRIKLGYTTVTDPGTPNGFTFTTTNSADVVTTYPGAAQTSTTMRSTDPDAYTVDDDEVRLLYDTGEVILGKNIADAAKTDISGNPAGRIDITYEKTGFAIGDKNPKVYFDCQDLNTGKTYTMDNQIIQYELGLNNKLSINILGKDIITSEFLNDVDDLIRVIENTSETTKEEYKIKYPSMTDEEIEELMEFESKAIQELFTDKFDKFNAKAEKHTTEISIQQTVLGGRLSRLDMITKRLEDDETNLEQLKSDNEDVNIAEIIIQLSVAQAIYDASLSVGAKILQRTLVDYI